LFHALRNAFALPGKARMLDIGCGNGATLRAFGQMQPEWSLVGTELGDRWRRDVERIEQVESLYTCPPGEVPGEFDVVTMIHVLEHIPGPKALLHTLHRKLVRGGLLVLELPHYAANPFELLIADHCTHFAAATAVALLESCGYEVLSVADDWVPKELTLVAGSPARAHEALPRRQRQPECHGATLPPRECVSQRLGWLADLAGAARQLAEAEEIGLFGTSIAATWLFGELPGAVRFFVDEDPSRVGKTHLGRPVRHPNDVPDGSHVLIPLPFVAAEAISRRLARQGVKYHLPPAL
jgi:SAM-dependent methyltransferase